ncbi:MAG TPA: autotransporter-associated beta strand repeat-containing protein, partial [Tepidisphaeraceae bacterium]
NMIDEGGGMIRSTLRNDYAAAGWWDGDRTTTNTDRQRAEVKGITGLGHQKVGDTFEYSFDFRTDPTFMGTAHFCHVFQLKATDGNDGPPLVTVSLYRNGSAIQGRVISSSDAGGGTVRTFNYTAGEWCHVVCHITTSAAGSATGAILTSINGDAFSGVSNQQIYLTGSTDYRPKWGLYRGIGVDYGVPAGDSWVEHRTVTGYIGTTNLLTWKGGLNSNTWDTGTTQNFLNGGTASVFNAVDQVIFDNTGSLNNNISLVGSISPNYVRVNSSANYTFAGSGSITGGTLRKDGSGSLTLATANSYPGLTDVRTGTLYVTGSVGNNSLVSITGGTLRAGSNAALGTNSTIGTQINGGALDINGFNLTTEPVSVQGSGIGGAGAIVNAGPQQSSALTKVTLTGDTTLGGTGRWDVRGSGASLSTGGNAYNLTKTGSNQISFVATAVDAALANITISQGVLAFQTSTSSMGDSTKALTVASGAILGFFNTTAAMSKVCTLNGGTVWGESGTGSQNTFAGPVTLGSSGGELDAGGALTGGTTNPNAVLTISGPIGGSGALTKNGPGTVTLNGANTYTGGTVVNSGLLVLNNADAVGVGSLDIRSGATVRAAPGLSKAVRVRKSLSIATGATLDLTSNSMVIDYDAPVGSLVSDVRNHLLNNRIISSTHSTNTTLGYADNAALGLSSFAGVAVDTTSLLIDYTFVGDTNLDGVVDVNDLANLASHWQRSADWTGGDLNYDGFVDATDLGMLALNWQAGSGGGGASLGAALSLLGLPPVSVPEPANATLLALTVLRLRRRTHQIH